MQCDGGGGGGTTAAYMHNEAHLALRKPRYDAGRTFPGCFRFRDKHKDKARNDDDRTMTMTMAMTMTMPVPMTMTKLLLLANVGHYALSCSPLSPLPTVL